MGLVHRSTMVQSLQVRNVVFWRSIFQAFVLNQQLEEDPSKGCGSVERHERGFSAQSIATSIEYILFLSLLLLVLPLVQAESGYSLDQCLANNQTIFMINNEGLTGSYVGFRSNTTYRKRANIEYTLWFTSTTKKEFTLSLVASNLPNSTQAPVNGWVPVDLQSVEGRIIWAANPNKPVGRQATFNVSENGNLELKDENGTLVWESKTGDKGATGFYLTDSGSLELRNATGGVVWQSSDSPTDTLMENQVLRSGMSLKISKNYSSMFQGPYTLALNEHAGVSLEYTSSIGEKQIYWTWNNAAGGNYSGLTLCNNRKDMFLQLQSSQTSQHDCDSTGSAGTWAVSKKSNATTQNEAFLKLEPDGDVSVYAWESTNWTKVYSLFENKPCGLPMKCGAYGVCQEGNCKGCIEHLEKNKDGVCVLGTRDCGKTTLVKLDGYEHFATNYSRKLTASPRACMDSCKCDCMAAFYIGNGSRGYCFITSDVGTIQRGSTVGAVAYIRVPKISKKKMTVVIAGSVVGALAGLFIAGILVCMVVRRLKAPVHLDSDADEEYSMLEMSIRSVLPTKFAYEDLEVFTDGFSHTLGVGSFGTVYKGSLSDGTEIAVKKLDKSDRDHKEFFAEIASMARNRHWSLLQLLGYSMKRSSRMLVYEYMSNGSLDSWLFNEEKKQELNWKIRFNIALGTAKGLAYLHEECAEKIMHLDLKPQNILLDSLFNAKIGDFGLSKLVERDQSLVMTMMRGTPGYLAPDWLIEGAITEKVDVYSFGVVLLELVTGQRSRNLLSSKISLQELVIQLQEQDQAADNPGELIGLEVVDHSLHQECSSSTTLEQMKRALRVGVLCIQNQPAQRPSMSKVVQMLEGTHPIATLCVQLSSVTSSAIFSSLSLPSLSGDVSTSVFTSSGGSSTFLFQ